MVALEMAADEVKVVAMDPAPKEVEVKDTVPTVQGLVAVAGPRRTRSLGSGTNCSGMTRSMRCTSFCIR